MEEQFSAQRMVYAENCTWFHIAGAENSKRYWSGERKWITRAMDQLIKRLLDHIKETGLDPEDTGELLKSCRGRYTQACLPMVKPFCEECE